jgi:hypothetical protein
MSVKMKGFLSHAKENCGWKLEDEQNGCRGGGPGSGY